MYFSGYKYKQQPLFVAAFSPCCGASRDDTGDMVKHGRHTRAESNAAVSIRESELFIITF